MHRLHSIFTFPPPYRATTLPSEALARRAESGVMRTIDRDCRGFTLELEPHVVQDVAAMPNMDVNARVINARESNAARAELRRDDDEWQH